jgi:hypothetical protein
MSDFISKQGSDKYPALDELFKRLIDKDTNVSNEFSEKY